MRQLSQDDTTAWSQTSPSWEAAISAVISAMAAHTYRWRQPRCGRGNTIESLESRVGPGERLRARVGERARETRASSASLADNCYAAQHERLREGRPTDWLIPIRVARWRHFVSLTLKEYDVICTWVKRIEHRHLGTLIPIRQAVRGASSRPYLLPQVPVADAAALATDWSATLYLLSNDICQGGASYRVSDASGITRIYTTLSREIPIETGGEIELRAFERPIEW